MGPGKRYFIAVTLATALPLGGCTHSNEQGPATDLPAPSRPLKLADAWLTGAKPLVPPAPAMAESDYAGLVLPATVPEQTDSVGSVVQTGGFFEKPTEAVKQGVNKVSEAITPTTPVTPPDDPTLLSTKSKPTPEVHLSMARYQEEVGKPALADQSYQQALRLSPKHLGALMAYAKFKQRQGQVQDAMQLYQKAAKFHPAEAAIYNDLGLLFARQGRNPEALAAFGKAIELQPKRALYRNNTAVLLVDIGQPDQAMKHLMTVYPEADACYKVGYLLHRKGQTHQAMASFSKALALNPALSDARVWLEHLQSQSGGEPQVARRLPGADAISERQSPTVRPDVVIQSDDPPAPSVPRLDPAKNSRGAVRQLPPVLKPLPSPPSDAQVPEAPAAPGLRRLPQTGAERPTSHQVIDEPAEREILWVDDRPPAPPDAPLPPPSAIRLPVTLPGSMR